MFWHSAACLGHINQPWFEPVKKGPADALCFWHLQCDMKQLLQYSKLDCTTKTEMGFLSTSGGIFLVKVYFFWCLIPRVFCTSLLIYEQTFLKKKKNTHSFIEV